MRDLDHLVIDDIESALRAMTPVGRSIAAESAQLVRSAVRALANRRGWFVIDYLKFVSWATQKVGEVDGQCIVLDPLFPLAETGDRFVALRMRRAAAPGHFEVAQVDLRPSPDRQPFIILDDAAASGWTLKRASELARLAGGDISSVIVGASTRFARDLVRSILPRSRWFDFMPGDWRIMHLRDGCASLPFTGGPIQRDCPTVEVGASAHVCTPTHCVPGSLWQAIYLDSNVRLAVDRARLLIANSLTAYLGRPATVGDVRLLGDSCQVMVSPGQHVGLHTTLESLL